MLAPSSSAPGQPPPPPPPRDSDSDSDWDDDDDDFVGRIDIKIKPATHMTPNTAQASMDQLKATVGTWNSAGTLNLFKTNSRRSQCCPVGPPPPPPIPPRASMAGPELAEPLAPALRQPTETNKSLMD